MLKAKCAVIRSEICAVIKYLMNLEDGVDGVNLVLVQTAHHFQNSI
jgi:hypothetical protein